MSCLSLSRHHMRKTTLILFSTLGALNAFAQQQDDDDRKQPTPVENLYFATDEFVYIPRNTLYVGLRVMKGASASFSGSSFISNPNVNVGDASGVYQYRSYHDGNVSYDTRTDGDGKPVASADGLTNTWTYAYAEQVSTEHPGYIAMHNYMASVSDTTPRSRDMGAVSGVELVLTRDLKQLSSRVYLCLSGAVGMSDLKSSMRTAVNGTLYTMTDYYSLNGAAAPAAGYSGPTSSTNTVTDQLGNSTTVTKDTTTYLGAEPANRTLTATTANGEINNFYRVKGAFLSARVGPTLYFPIWGKFRGSVSVGAAAVYAGSTFSVEQEYTPETGDPITNSVSSVDKKVMPGYYVDANVEYWMTERAGFYAGASYQSSSNYTQTIENEQTKYATKIEFKGLSGLRAGVNLRF